MTNSTSAADVPSEKLANDDKRGGSSEAPSDDKDDKGDHGEKRENSGEENKKDVSVLRSGIHEHCNDHF
jgi:hypothetical protein